MSETGVEDAEPEEPAKKAKVTLTAKAPAKVVPPPAKAPAKVAPPPPRCRPLQVHDDNDGAKPASDISWGDAAGNRLHHGEGVQPGTGAYISETGSWWST
eukprot:11827703-Karenia_brevis.AAC.2